MTDDEKLKNTLKQSSEKRNLDQNINDSKTHICNSFFLKILFRAYIFSPHVPVDIIRVFFIPEFVAENLKANKSQRKISLILQYSFVQKTTVISQISTLMKLKTKCSQNTAKKLSQFTNFPANKFLFGVRKNICTAPFPDATELLSWSTLKANVCIFLCISQRKVFFQRRSKILSGGMGGWGDWMNNFLKAARCLALVKCFTIFHFNWNFSKFHYFSVFRYFPQ